MPAILFGSISTVADTSELQRRAFNEAFEAHGLQWHWNRDDYRAMLATSGGLARIADFADSRGESVDAPAVHARKSSIFHELLARSEVVARPGVIETIKATKGAGWKVGLVTTTSPENIVSLLAALNPAVRREDFDVIIDSSLVEEPKPDNAAYTQALRELGESATDCVAIEDNADGIRAATAAGVACVAFPNENTVVNDLTGATQRVDHLDADDLQQLVTKN